MINYNENIERQGVYKQYFEKFGEDPITYGLYWNDLDALEKLLLESIKSGIKYSEEKPEEGVIY